jgi:2-iminobutanoate/2-iminopropanoate deaminase
MKRLIETDKAPIPIAPYSQAVEAQGTFIFISGQIALGLDGQIVGDDILSQTEQTIKNLSAILESQGLSLDNIVKTTCLLSDMNNFADFNKVYEQYFGVSKPARATYGVVELPRKVLVEIEAIAVK